MGLGFWLARRFPLDLGSLSKLNFYVFIPVFMFYSLLIFKPAEKEMAETVVFNLLLAGATFPLIYLLTRAFRFTPGLAAASTLGTLIFNSANYGLPVVQLAFQGEGVAIQVITITTMNILTYTLGVLIAGGWNEWRKGLRTILQLPDPLRPRGGPRHPKPELEPSRRPPDAHEMDRGRHASRRPLNLGRPTGQERPLPQTSEGNRVDGGG